MLPPRHIAVVRFSAMGDVAMAVPVIIAVLATYPQLHITFISNAFHRPLFDGIERCTFFAADLTKTHKGVTGMWKVFHAIKKLHHFEALADLHDVLRTKILRMFFKLSGTTAAVIDKGRSEKKALISKDHKILRQLPTSHERYAKVFAALGFPVDLSQQTCFKHPEAIPEPLQLLLQQNKRLVGIAPFARHGEKMYPLEKMKVFLELLNERKDIQMLLFGAPGAEATQLEVWEQEFAGSINVAGKISLAGELSVISNLSLMITMDSANMHMASVYGVPVVSIWGATHPYAGFNGWRQDEANIVQAALYCRPCSVFGNKPCFRGDHACMHLVSPLKIMQRVDAVLDRQQ